MAPLLQGTPPLPEGRHGRRSLLPQGQAGVDPGIEPFQLLGAPAAHVGEPGVGIFPAQTPQQRLQHHVVPQLGCSEHHDLRPRTEVLVPEPPHQTGQGVHSFRRWRRPRAWPTTTPTVPPARAPWSCHICLRNRHGMAPSCRPTTRVSASSEHEPAADGPAERTGSLAGRTGGGGIGAIGQVHDSRAPEAGSIGGVAGQGAGSSTHWLSQRRIQVPRWGFSRRRRLWSQRQLSR